jgi:hypothetical protein
MSNVNTTAAIKKRRNVTSTGDMCNKIGFVATIEVPQSAAAPATASIASVVVGRRRRWIEIAGIGREGVRASTGCPFRGQQAIQRRRSGDSAPAHPQTALHHLSSPHATATHDTRIRHTVIDRRNDGILE